MSSTEAAGEVADRPSRRRWVRVVSGTVVALLVAVLAIFAVRADGEPVHDVAMTDGGVWVSGGRTGHWARVSTGAHAFDVVLDGAGDIPEQDYRAVPGERSPGHVRTPDVLQDGRHAVGVTSQGELVGFDTRTGEALEPGPSLPERAPQTGQLYFQPDIVDLRGGTIAMVDSTDGQVWAVRLDPSGRADLSGLGPGAPTVADIGGSAAVAVDVTGNVKAVSAETGEVVDIPVEGDGFGAPERTDVEIDGIAADVTAVGEDWVVMDGASGEIFHEREPTEPETLPDGGQVGEEGTGLVVAALQQPGPEADRVAVQTVAGTAFVDLAESVGGEQPPEIVSGLDAQDRFTRQIKISRPVVLGDCVTAAWGRASSILHARACEPGSTGVSQISPAGDTGRRAGVAVRYNQGQLVLNDLETGRVYDLALPTDELRIDTWPVPATRRTPSG